MNILKELQAFNKYIFIDDGHRYINLEDEDFQYMGWSSFIAKFTKPFDTKKHSTNKAKKTGLDADYIAQTWATKSDIGKLRGSIVHDYCEKLWANKRFPIHHPSWVMRLGTQTTINYINSVNTMLKYSDEYFMDYKQRFIPIRLELVLGDEDHKLASMVDKLVYDVVLDCVGIVDYKTDKQFSTYSYYKEKEKFLPPISHLDKCEKHKYGLQLQLYKYIIEKYTDIKIEFRKIVWFNPKNDSYVILDMDDYEDELQLMLDSIL